MSLIEERDSLRGSLDTAIRREAINAEKLGAARDEIKRLLKERDALFATVAGMVKEDDGVDEWDKGARAGNNTLATIILSLLADQMERAA
jgi:hypothetical protein